MGTSRLLIEAIVINVGCFTIIQFAGASAPGACPTADIRASLAAAQAAAAEQEIPGQTETIEYEDEKGGGTGRPQATETAQVTVVKDNPRG